MLARRFAIALRDDGFRATVARALRTAEPEGKVYLQGFLSADRGAARHRLAELSGTGFPIASQLCSPPKIEIYLPAPSIGAVAGNLNVLVATAEGDREAPVAFDPRGRRRLLDPDRPPGVPVIALGRAETRFAEPGLAFNECMTCFGDPGDGGGGSAAPTAGLYMTYTRFTEEFAVVEGDPEFEVTPGQDGNPNVRRATSARATGRGTYGSTRKVRPGRSVCSQPGPGDYYKASIRPGVRVFLLEDDDARHHQDRPARVERCASADRDLRRPHRGKDSTVFSSRLRRLFIIRCSMSLGDHQHRGRRRRHLDRRHQRRRCGSRGQLESSRAKTHHYGAVRIEMPRRVTKCGYPRTSDVQAVLVSPGRSGGPYIRKPVVRRVSIGHSRHGNLRSRRRRVRRWSRYYRPTMPASGRLGRDNSGSG